MTSILADSAPAEAQATNADTATPAERERFLVANNGDQAMADAAIEKYLEWRQTYLKEAYKIWEENKDAVTWVGLLGCKDSNDQDCRCDKVNRDRIVYVQGAQINLDIGVDVIVACIAVFFDKSLSRNSREMVTAMVDLRKGPPHWQNRTGYALVPLARAFNAIFKPYFPERLRKMVVYPMPWYGMAVWSIVAIFLDPKTKSKVHLLRGPSDPVSTEPFTCAPDPDELKIYVDEAPAMEMIIGGGVSPVMQTSVAEREEELHGDSEFEL